MGRSVSVFRAPSVWYWLLSFLPVCSYAVASLYAFKICEFDSFNPIPSVVAGYEETGYFVGVPAIVVVIAISAISLRTFRRFRRLKTSLNIAVLYTVPLIGAFGAIFYAFMALITIQQFSVSHIVLHLSSLFLLWLFFIGTNAVLITSGHGKVAGWIWLFDGIIFVVLLFYAFVLFIWHIRDSISNEEILVITAVAYLSISVLFARFPVNGWQVLGPEFVIPFRRAKKV
jgi:hypothetical protein